MATVYPPKRILVLGATSAIAMAVMRQLVTPAAHFFLVARSKDKLTAVAQDLLVRGALRVDMIVTDLDDTQAHPQMLAVATSQLGTIDLALLAHGVLGDQAAAERDYVVAEPILVTNFLSAVSLLTWLANYCESQGRGTLAVISSVAGDRGARATMFMAPRRLGWTPSSPACATAATAPGYRCSPSSPASSPPL